MNRGGFADTSGVDIAEFASYLLPGERVVWAGRPAPGFPWDRVDRFLVPFSIVWSAVAVGTLVQGLQSGNTLGVAVSMLLCPVAAYLLVGRFLYKFYLRRRTRFAITDRRALVLVGGRRPMVRSAMLRDAQLIERRSTEGRGTLQFGPASFFDTIYGTTGLEALGRVPPNAIPVFFDIPNVHQVYQLAAGLQR